MIHLIFPHTLIISKLHQKHKLMFLFSLVLFYAYQY
nr:MAG TPA_asm: hypothetical protein [Bacteriophage sp.]